jgi:hypothetical protein
MSKTIRKVKYSAKKPKRKNKKRIKKVKYSY